MYESELFVDTVLASFWLSHFALNAENFPHSSSSLSPLLFIIGQKMNKNNAMEHSISFGEKNAGARWLQTPKLLKVALKANSEKSFLSPQK